MPHVTHIFRLRALDLLRKATRVRDVNAEEKSKPTQFRVLSAQVIAIQTRSSDGTLPGVCRAPSHRPSPSSYRTAMSVYFLRCLGQQSSPAVSEAGSAPGGPGLQSDPLPVIHNLFSPMSNDENEKSPAARDQFLDHGAFFELCQEVLPRDTSFAVVPFNPDRAVVFVVNRNKTIQCVAGWSRWSALLALQARLNENVRTKVANLNEKTLQHLNGPVPVYLIDGTELTSYDLIQLSSALNYMDMPLPDFVDLFAAPSAVYHVRSRPHTLLCRLWTLHLIVANIALAAPNTDSSVPFLNLLLETIEAAPPLVEYRTWLLNEADALFQSLWINNPLILPPSVSLTPQDCCFALLTFMLSLSWPVSSLKIPRLSLSQLKALLGPDFPFGPMGGESPQKSFSRCSSFFWDELLTHHLPYQIQVSYSLSDLMGIVRTFEIFFLPRSQLQNKALLDLNWVSAENVSLVNHFARNDTAEAFVERIVTNNAFRSIAPASLWSFEHLSSFICLYHLHFLFELESEGGHTVVPPEPPLVFTPGVQRTLTLMRAIVMMAFFTYDNAAQFLDLSRLSDPQVPNVLNLPPPIKSDVSVLNQLAFTVSASNGKIFDDRKVTEEQFELLLGMLSELLIRGVLAGVTREAVAPAMRSTLDVLKARRSAQETMLVPKKDVLLSETLRAGALLIQTFLRTLAWRPQLDLVGLFPSGEGCSSGFQSLPITGLLDARQKAYELIAKTLARVSGVATCSHYQFVWSILEPLMKRPRNEAADHATCLLCGAKRKDSKMLSRTTPSPPLMTLSAPSLESQAPQAQVISAEEVWKRVSEVARNRGMSQAELLSRVCAQRHSNGTTSDLTELSSRLHRGGTSRRAPAETQQRITHWFEQRTTEARGLLSSIFKAMQAVQNGGSNAPPPVTISADFRNMTPEEAKEAAGPLSDLSQESTNVLSSLHEIPYQLQVEDVSILPFAQESLVATCDQIEPLLQSHLADGLKQLLLVKEPGHSVVCSARPAIICALWQTLIRLSPFLDVLHPLALHWNEVRALFCSWLWRNLRIRLDSYWTKISQQSFGPGDELPALRWSMRCLPSDQDHNYLASLPDLTADRLKLLLEAPRLLDRICAAFYRFQCSGMANAKAALGNAQTLAPTADNLNKIFSSNENCLKNVFSNLWERVQAGTTVEDALHNPDIAAACFLKRYAPYVLSGLENQDKAIEGSTGLAVALETGTEVEEPAIKRRRRELYAQDMADEESNTRLKRVPTRGAELPPALILSTASVQTLKRELRQRGVAGRIRKPGRWAVDEKSDEDLSAAIIQSSNHQEPGVWLQALPLSMKERLNRALPTDEIYSAFNKQTETQIENQTSPEESPGESVADLRNGVFPALPEWLESTPAWSLWGPPSRKGDTVGSPWHHSEDPITTDRCSSSSLRRLSNHATLVQASLMPEISERDWALIKCTLHCLS
eukprot:Gregarina_sp_Poly_1__2718@NODE_174_length_12038_cov_79_466461_g10_i1_p2_GENE_NODE_174_length_12038_cov_79_466461_g10_i1NODE_174_length_12038_cov_79_466461_g10_i1_p2_ORF_typecomplete_len1446_score225_51RHH_4/PF13467_6/0_093_NODE_174_length_12038_cov_79_466461_g10_i1760711944